MTHLNVVPRIPRFPRWPPHQHLESRLATDPDFLQRCPRADLPTGLARDLKFPDSGITFSAFFASPPFLSPLVGWPSKNAAFVSHTHRAFAAEGAGLGGLLGEGGLQGDYAGFQGSESCSVNAPFGEYLLSPTPDPRRGWPFQGEHAT